MSIFPWLIAFTCSRWPLISGYYPSCVSGSHMGHMRLGWCLAPVGPVPLLLPEVFPHFCSVQTPSSQGTGDLRRHRPVLSYCSAEWVPVKDSVFSEWSFSSGNEAFTPSSSSIKSVTGGHGPGWVFTGSLGLLFEGLRQNLTLIAEQQGDFIQSKTIEVSKLTAGHTSQDAQQP